MLLVAAVRQNVVHQHVAVVPHGRFVVLVHECDRLLDEVPDRRPSCCQEVEQLRNRVLEVAAHPELDGPRLEGVALGTGQVQNKLPGDAIVLGFRGASFRLVRDGPVAPQVILVRLFAVVLQLTVPRRPIRSAAACGGSGRTAGLRAR